MMISRTKNSIRNIVFTLGSYFVILILQMINRTMFVKYLPIEYLGVNGLFSNILSLLSLTELGIGTAITYSLYMPLSNGNIEVIKSIMKLYRKLYMTIGCAVLIMGVILGSVLHIFIGDISNFETYQELQVYFLIYVINTSISYLGSYKRTLLICDQKQYITSIVSAACKGLLTFAQIFEIIIFRDYKWYLMLMIFATVGENILLTSISNKKYPYLKSKYTQKLDMKILKDIKKNVFAMMFHRVGDVIINASDNMIITRFASLLLTGLYSNYVIIISSIRTILNQMFSALTASVGNLVAESDRKNDYEIFKKILFINYIIYSLCAVSLSMLLNDFIEIWLGPEYLLDKKTVNIVCLSFYITGMLKTVRIFRDAAGVFYYDRYKPVAEAVINIALSIPLTIKYQIFGTVIGTIVSNLSVSFWIEGYVLFKYHFRFSSVKYFLQQFKYLIIYIVLLGLYEFIFMIFSCTGIGGLCIKAVIISVSAVLVNFLLFRKTDELQYTISLVKKLIDGKI